jgi:hypothetical protein
MHDRRNNRAAGWEAFIRRAFGAVNLAEPKKMTRMHE